MRISNKLYAVCRALSVVCGASAQSFTEWRDAGTNEVNRLPMRTVGRRMYDQPGPHGAL